MMMVLCAQRAAMRIPHQLSVGYIGRNVDGINGTRKIRKSCRYTWKF